MGGIVVAVAGELLPGGSARSTAERAETVAVEVSWPNVALVAWTADRDRTTPSATSLAPALSSFDPSCARDASASNVGPASLLDRDTSPEALAMDPTNSARQLSTSGLLVVSDMFIAVCLKEHGASPAAAAGEGTGELLAEGAVAVDVPGEGCSIVAAAAGDGNGAVAALGDSEGVGAGDVGDGSDGDGDGDDI